MSAPLLTNYLKSNRKRLALSQDEVAFLMGARGGAKVSRYERFAREPSLKSALAFEVIYKQAASKLFDGLYREIKKEIAGRAKILTYRKDRKPNAIAARKRETLTALANI